MKILYIDCISGISGDMFIGALIDAGANPDYLAEELKKLQMEEEYELKWTRTIKNGITGTKFDVVLTGHQPHSHTPSAFKVLGSHHHHDNRTYRHIVGMIEAADFEEQVKDTALRIFKKIGEAEARIHGIPLDQVHFHEVGAVDSIIDIVGAAILIDHMNIAKIICSPIPVGSGKIRIDHGIYPVPAPATLEILKGVPLEQSNIRYELTTPTGAAIAAVLAEQFGTTPAMTVHAVGYGAGTKSFPEHPNVLRVMLGE